MAKFFVSALTLGLIGSISCTGYSNGNSYGNSNGNLPSSVIHPIFSKHNVEINKVAGSIERNAIPDIVISSGGMQMKMIFQSESTDLNVEQSHKNADGKTDSSNSQDGQIVLNHSVTKPVVQYVSEEIVPSRYLSQKVAPVKEYVKTVVTKNAAYSQPEPEPKY